MRPLERWMSLGLLWLAVAAARTAEVGGQRPANELGSVMILEYHRIGEPEGRWTRSPTHLRDDLGRLRAAGYRAIALEALVTGSIDLPAGTSPVVLTFDDSSPGQFHFVEQDDRLAIDPDCAVGILEAFVRIHPEFGLKATFFVLPAAAEPNRLFGQPEHEARKLQYLVSRGFELGNHTFWHADLARYPEPVVKSQLARAQQRIAQVVPGYRLRALALPMGNYPARLDWAIRGRAAGIDYEHDAIVMVGGGPAPSPFLRRFDPYHLPRIQAVGSAVADWIRYFDQHPGRRFVSDGDPGTVAVPEGRLGDTRPRAGQKVRVVE
jgi:hypothetical protein